MGDEPRLKHIFDYVLKIESAIKDRTFKEFVEDEIVVAAIERWLEIIGEAAKHISEETKKMHPKVEWKKMAVLRNIVTHGNFAINNEIIWETASIHIMELKKHLENNKT